MNQNENMSAIEILNFYRNCHYMDSETEESRIIADALNEILPKIKE